MSRLTLRRLCSRAPRIVMVWLSITLVAVILCSLLLYRAWKGQMVPASGRAFPHFPGSFACSGWFTSLCVAARNCKETSRRCQHDRSCNTHVSCVLPAARWLAAAMLPVRVLLHIFPACLTTYFFVYYCALAHR